MSWAALYLWGRCHHGFPLQIYAELDRLAAEYGSIVSKLQIGQSYEKRPLYVLKVRHSSPNVCERAGVHTPTYMCVIDAVQSEAPRSIRGVPDQKESARALKLSVSFDSSALAGATVLRSGWTPGSIPESGLPKRAPCGSLERSLPQGWIVLLPRERLCLFKSTSHPTGALRTLLHPLKPWRLQRERGGCLDRELGNAASSWNGGGSLGRRNVVAQVKSLRTSARLCIPSLANPAQA